MSSNSGPKYHISHASGIEIIPNQNKTSGNNFIFSSSGRVVERCHPNTRCLRKLTHRARNPQRVDAVTSEHRPEVSAKWFKADVSETIGHVRVVPATDVPRLDCSSARIISSLSSRPQPSVACVLFKAPPKEPRQYDTGTSVAYRRKQECARMASRCWTMACG